MTVQSRSVSRLRVKLAASALVGAIWPGLAHADCLDNYFVYGRDALVLADRTHVGAKYIGSEHYLEVGADSQIHARAVAPEMFLRSYALVNGAAYTVGPIAAQQGAMLTGALRTVGEAPSCAPPATITVTPSANDVVVELDQTLPPGSYGNVSVAWGATLQVSGGDYHFASLTFEPDTRLVTRWSGQPARLLVRDWVQIGDRHEQTVSRPRGIALSVSPLEIYTQQSHELRLGTDSVFEARIVAPAAEVIVSSRTDFRDRLYAGYVQVEPDVKLGRYVNITTTMCSE